MNKIIYLDAAASSLKPDAVIDAEMRFLRDGYANSGRGVCARAMAVDDMVSHTRKKVAEFINAPTSEHIVFTGGTTDGMNRIVRIINDSVGGNFVANKTVMVSNLDHHSARLPFEVLSDSCNCNIVLCPMDVEHNLSCSNLPRADIFVITAMSNVLGMPQDVSRLISAAREKNPNVITVVDAAQYVAHDKIDVQKWDCDFMCFSAHKIGADTGLGVMYMKNPEKWISPDKFGGGMVSKITGDASSGLYTLQWEMPPAKFEAGTLPLTQIAGLAPAIDYLSRNRPDSKLVQFLYDELIKVPRIKILTQRDACMLTFVVAGQHVLDFGALAGARGLCLRVGNMCATWIHRVLGVPGSIRLSPGVWNTMDEMRQTVDIIKGLVK